MVNAVAIDLIPGDEVEIDGEMWLVTHHGIWIDGPHPIQMRLAACADRHRGKTVLTTLTHPYKRALRYCEDGPADNVKYLGMTENGTRYRP